MKRILVLLLFSVWISSTPVYSQEKAGEAAEHAEKSPLSTVFKWGNAIVLFGALIYLLRKPAGEFFENRKKQISSGLERAEEAQTTAGARMEEIEQLLASMSADIAALRAEAVRESATERDKILAEAKREVDRVVEQSRQEIDLVA